MKNKTAKHLAALRALLADESFTEAGKRRTQANSAMKALQWAIDRLTPPVIKTLPELLADERAAQAADRAKRITVDEMFAESEGR